MQFQKTTAVDKILNQKSRTKIIQGGSSAGKTIAILLILIDRAQSNKTTDKELISVVSESMPHLKRGAIRDFLNIMKAHGYFKESLWNRTDNIYTFETGTQLEFFSADNPGKVRGPRREVLFINEANNIPFETYTQLAIRTNKEVYIDYNPVAEFWAHTDLKGKDNVDFTILTYRDNEGLSDAIVKELESRKGYKNWWRVYGEGLIGEIEGKIYKDWAIIDEIPHEARLERRGLDFGYSNDPTAIVDIYYYNGGYIIDELVYKKGMHNKQIADTILQTEKDVLVIADSAEPKSIDELKLYGINCQPTVKGQGSIVQGIQYVQGQKMSVTKRSVNVLKEYRNYMWMEDKDGKIINEPVGGLDHAMDAIRYGMNIHHGSMGEEDFEEFSLYTNMYS